MSPFISLVPLLVQSFISLLTNGLFWIIVVLVALLYRRAAKVSRQLFYLPEEPVWPALLTATAYGMVGGLLGSLLVIVVGISLLEIGLSYLWITALFLMLIRQRFLCFAYGGGILSLANLILGYPEVSVPQIMGLVAILHMVESLLIYFSGHHKPVPLYIRAPGGRIVGGYNLQKFWPLPLVVLFTWVYPNQEMLQGAVQMPDWWPLIKTQFLQGEGDPVYMMMPVVAALGYGDIALTSLPRDKTRRAALDLGIYSFVLLMFAVIAGHYPGLALIPALLGPLGHEVIIHLGLRREMKGIPYFVPPPRGVMVLHVIRGSSLSKAGIEGGDIILSVNGSPVNNELVLRNILIDAGKMLEFEFYSARKKGPRRVCVKGEEADMLSFVPVPQGYEHKFMEVSGSAGVLQKWWNRLKNP